MSAGRDYDKLLTGLRREGWKVREEAGLARAEHPGGGSIEVRNNHPSIHRARTQIRHIEDKYEEAQRQRIRTANGGNCNGPPRGPRPAPPPAPPPKDNQRSTTMPEKNPGNDSSRPAAADDAMLELLAEQSSKIDGLGLQLAALGRKIEQLLARLQEEADRRADAEAFARRQQLLDEELKDLPVDGTRIITFDTEAEQVAHTRALHTYGLDRGKEFRPTKEGLRTSIWRVK